MRGAVAEPVLRVFDADAVFRQAAGVVVAQFVEGDVDACGGRDAFEAFRPDARILQSAAGVTEAAINMEIAMWLAIYLREAGQEVLLTREGDIESDNLTERCRMANEWEADIFISIHCNAAANSAARGFEVYHYPGSQEGYELAERIRAALAELNYTLDRGVKEARFAVLVECGFMTNEQELELLRANEMQRAIAEATAAALI